MNSRRHTNIVVIKEFSSFINNRDIVRDKFKRLSSVLGADKVVIDFDEVEFVSRSAMHEILSLLRDEDVVVEFKNEVPDVRAMRITVSDSMSNPIKRAHEATIWKEPVTDIRQALDMIM